MTVQTPTNDTRSEKSDQKPSLDYFKDELPDRKRALVKQIPLMRKVDQNHHFWIFENMPIMIRDNKLVFDGMAQNLSYDLRDVTVEKSKSQPEVVNIHVKPIHIEHNYHWRDVWNFLS
eukprot:CAMPEP_0114584666 /NCGR_PEP_ID=MMETSP0125-20121206/8331_1 /TAXON_ID=485358 ORGANISM="Aristerostoma sp., Strain ATCC 50986" /NCGR_SAMPLE_ID=MMETSP0125 /ASSEMBLY_ACC=CAM_ASM_000245 /LENGTH=117 /DNA_ID=CAMNT_0001779215 /DNA_START=39 /DNA_END=392 /DNA_ORIENTATION=+